MKKSRAFIPFYHAESIVYIFHPIADISFRKAAREFQVFQAVRRGYHYNFVNIRCERYESTRFQFFQCYIFVLKPLLQIRTEGTRFEKFITQ